MGLRARTFPSFAHLHNKPGYPDEKRTEPNLISFETFINIIVIDKSFEILIENCKNSKFDYFSK